MARFEFNNIDELDLFIQKSKDAFKKFEEGFTVKNIKGVLEYTFKEDDIEHNIHVST